MHRLQRIAAAKQDHINHLKRQAPLGFLREAKEEASESRKKTSHRGRGMVLKLVSAKHDCEAETIRCTVGNDVIITNTRKPAYRHIHVAAWTVMTMAATTRRFGRNNVCFKKRNVNRLHASLILFNQADEYRAEVRGLRRALEIATRDPKTSLRCSPRFMDDEISLSATEGHQKSSSGHAKTGEGRRKAHQDRAAYMADILCGRMHYSQPCLDDDRCHPREIAAGPCALSERAWSRATHRDGMSQHQEASPARPSMTDETIFEIPWGSRRAIDRHKSSHASNVRPIPCTWNTVETGEAMIPQPAITSGDGAYPTHH